MDISDAILAVKAGQRATRATWVDDDLESIWIEMRQPGPHDDWLPHVAVTSVLPNGHVRHLPWDPRIEDVMADDWEIF